MKGVQLRRQYALPLSRAEPSAIHGDRGETSSMPSRRPRSGIIYDSSQTAVDQHGLQFRFVDLFAGIGGLRKPFEEIGGRCVFTSEWDRFARETYRANHRETDNAHRFVGDIRPFSAAPELIPVHDVLLAGFPCQPFSLAGVSKKNALGRPHGFLDDTQGTLFYDVAKIVQHHQPEMFLLENVRNLVSHDKGRTFATILNVLENEIGYHVQYRIISAEAFVPQKRERIFIVGFRQKTGFDLQALELPQGRRPVLGDILEANVDPKYTLSDHLWGYLQRYREKHAAAGNGFGCSVFGPNDVARTLSARYHKDGSEILIDQGPGKPPRRLTPRECARLMGFDEPQGSEFKIPVSDTQAYRQFGNSVAVPVIRFIAESIRPWLVQALEAKLEERQVA
jgi:DNA (cytosine-5)-methyltransferase 1